MAKRQPVQQTPRIAGSHATFTWRGSGEPLLLGDFNHWEPEQALSMLEVKPGVWELSVELPDDAYIEYTYWLDGEQQLDPTNPNTVENGFDGENNFFYMPQGGPTPLAQRQPGVRRGKLRRYRLEDEFTLVGRQRFVYLYRPPVNGPYPLLVVLDGTEYLQRANLVNLVDNLIAQGRIRPVALALLKDGRQARYVEYSCNDATLEFIQEKVLPLARENLELIVPPGGDSRTSPGEYGVMGASMGGLMALYAGLRLPHIFGKVISQSGAFLPGSVIHELVCSGSPAPLKIWMDAGGLEGLKVDNRKMADSLVEKGYAVTYSEFNGGHNYTAWQNDIWRGIEALFQ